MITFIWAALLLWLGALVITYLGYARRGWRDWYRDVLAVGLLGLACVGYFWRLILDDAFMPADGGDLISFLWPTYRFAAQALGSGQWPLWNPHLYSGAPHVADIQAGFLYPVNLLLFLVYPNFGVKAMEGLSTLHMWWAGLGMYVFVRSLGRDLGRIAALAAGIAFAFSDGFWVHFGNLNYIAVASWLPWVMVCFVRALGESRTAANRAGWAAIAGALLGVGTLAGHVQATLFIALTVALYGIFWLLWELREIPQHGGRSRHLPPIVRLLLAITFLAVVAFLIAAPVLLPALQLTGYSARAQWSYQETVGYSWSPAQWIGLLVPGFFGRGPQLHWGLWPRVEAGYLGILPLALAALAVLARRNRQTWTLLGLTAVTFVLSLGIYSILHGWLSLLPGFDLLRAPARLVLVMDFGLAALAAIGLQVLLDPVSEGENWRALTRLQEGLGWVAKVALVIVVPLTFGALLLAQDKDPTVYLRVGVAAIAILLFVAFLLASLAVVAARKAGWARPATLGALALALIFLDLASTGAYNDLGSENPAQAFNHPQIAEFLAQDDEPFRIDARTEIDQVWQPNTALLYGLDDVWGIANPSTLAHYERYWEGMGSRSSSLYDFLNARYVIAGKDVDLDWDKFELAFEGDPNLNVYRNQDALPRAQLIRRAQVEPDAEAAWEAIHAPGFDPGQQVVVSGPAVWSPDPAAAGEDDEITWVQRSATEMLLEVKTGKPAYLVLSEVWYPGWRWQIGDAGGPVERANYAFSAVPITSAGVHTVRLQFTPPGWRVGLALAGVTLLTLALVVVLAGIRRRRQSRESKVGGM